MQPDCGNCTLDCKKVPTSSRENPNILFIGEAPGKTEVETGVPFTGQAGQIIRAISAQELIPEDALGFANICLCRPPENRNPSAKEIKACWPRLEEEIRELDPDIIVCLGAVPSKAIIPGCKLRDDRGKVYETEFGVPAIPTFHPASVLYPKGEGNLPFIEADVQKAWRIVAGNTREHPEETAVVIIDGPDLMESLLDRLDDEHEYISYDWETSGLMPGRDAGICLGLSWKEGTAVVIPVEWVRKFARQLNKALRKHRLVGFNAVMFDALWNKLYGLPDTVYHDAMFMHYALDERPQRRSLENLTVQLLDAPAYESTMLMEYGTTKKHLIRDVPLEEIYKYCGKDVDWCLRLTKVLEEKLKKFPQLEEMYRSILLPGGSAMAKVQFAGVWVDQDKMEEVTKDYKGRADELEQEIIAYTGKSDFNVRSHPQVQGFLWDTLCLEEPKLYGRDPRSADKETLKALLEDYPEEKFVRLLLEYRELFTLYSRYLHDLPIDPDGRVRASYHLDRTETGRLSTTEPAIHQTPRESSIRTIYSAPPGRTLVQVDYEQVEMRMAAHCAHDRKLMQSFKELEDSGFDFHTYMASVAFETPIEEVTKDQRQAAKTVSFGLLYRMSDKGLASRLGLSITEAKEIISDYERGIPDVVNWIKRIESQVRKKRYVETIFGRRRRFPIITNRNIKGLQREAVNFPIQSAASDLTLLKVVELTELFEQYYPEVSIVIMSHDEIVTECPNFLAEEIAANMIRIMEEPIFETQVPFKASCKIGPHWGQGESFSL